MPILMAIKKELLGDNPLYFCFQVVTSVATSPYPFYFIFEARVASNGEEVRFGEVAVPELILCCHQKNSFSQPVRRIDLKFFVSMPQVIIKLLLVLHFSI
jgi:hypothetical protein